MKAAVDSSVLLALGKLGYLKLVGQLFDKLFVAQSVFEEISGANYQHKYGVKRLGIS